jgi:hypothetical protein
MKTYTVTASVTDNETGNVIFKAEIPTAKRDDVIGAGMSTPGVVPVARLLLESVNA